jgi:hypothetical protein
LFFSADEADVTTVLHGKIKAAKLDFVLLGVSVAGAVLFFIIIIIFCWKVKLHKFVLL